jgi:hypothetical protein
MKWPPITSFFESTAEVSNVQKGPGAITQCSDGIFQISSCNLILILVTIQNSFFFHFHNYLNRIKKIQATESTVVIESDKPDRVREVDMQLFRRKISSVSYVLPKITTLPLRKTGGNFSRFKRRCDGEPFHLKRPLVGRGVVHIIYHLSLIIFCLKYKYMVFSFQPCSKLQLK